VAQYEAYATSLAFLRHRGRKGKAGADFVVRERELLDQLWQHRDVARPALEYAARATAPVRPMYAAPVPAPAAHWPGYGYPGPGYGYPGPGYGYPAAPYSAYNPYQS
jgi:hypothetical protein